MSKLIILIGLARSGKSTLADYLIKLKSFQLVCQDDIRKAFGHDFNNKTEPMVRAISHTIVRSFMERKLAIILDETNTSLFNLNNWVNLADEYKYEKIGIILKVNKDECIKRNDETKRDPRLVPAIERMNNNLISLLDNPIFLFENFKSILLYDPHPCINVRNLKNEEDLRNLQNFFKCIGGEFNVNIARRPDMSLFEHL